MQADLNEDFQALINCLTAQSVEYILVGAHALAFHGVARYTEDLDVWVARHQSNALRIRGALRDFGITISEADALQLLQDRKFLRFGNKPRRVEVLNFLDGCDFATAYERANAEQLGGTDVKVLSLEDYVATKRASARPKDHSDLVLLRNAIGQLPGDSEE